MTTNEERCEFCRGKETRNGLAEALLSGKYQEQHEPWETNPLRDENDRYTVTGVACAAVSPIVWVRYPENWRDPWTNSPGFWKAVWIDELMHVLPNRRGYENQQADNLNESELDALDDIGAGDSQGCPEITAHNLGLREKNNLIVVTAGAIPPEDRERVGIRRSQTGEYPIDRMKFAEAAKILTEHPESLGECRCNSQVRPAEQELTCPACGGTGGVDVGVGFLSCSMCRGQGATNEERIAEYEQTRIHWD